VKRRFRQTCDDSAVSIEISTLEGPYRPAAQARSAAGWTYAERLLAVKVSERFEPVRFTIRH